MNSVQKSAHAKSAHLNALAAIACKNKKKKKKKTSVFFSNRALTQSSNEIVQR